MYAEVLVEYGVKSLDRPFTYSVPKNLKDKLKKGMKVIVPFGKLEINGFVIDIKDTCELDDIKPIIKIADEEIFLGEELLLLGKHLQDRTLCSLITAYNTMFPTSMKIKEVKTNYALYDSFLDLKNEKDAYLFMETNKRSIKARELIERLLAGEEVLKNEYSAAVINKLAGEGIITIRK